MITDNTKLLQSLKEGVLFARLAHERIANIAAEKVGFSQDIVSILIEHSNDPDKEDWGFDRFWKHFYDPVGNSGGAPISCERTYQLAVNKNDLVGLSKASHYLMDVGCVFHTTFLGQGWHLRYERWIDDNIDEIISMIDLDSIESIIIDNIANTMVELAEKTNARYYVIVDDIKKENYDDLKRETAEDLKDVIAYTCGLYSKFIKDIGGGTNYPIYREMGLNIIMLPLLLLASFVIYNEYKKKIMHNKLLFYCYKC